MTDLIEIDTALLSLMGNRNMATEKKKEGFNNILKSYKENFGLEISTEYLRQLLISNGTDNRNATRKVSQFINRNDIKPSVEKVTAVKPLKWLGYCDAGFNGENRIKENTLSFFR